MQTHVSPTKLCIHRCTVGFNSVVKSCVLNAYCVFHNCIIACAYCVLTYTLPLAFTHAPPSCSYPHSSLLLLTTPLPLALTHTCRIILIPIAVSMIFINNTILSCCYSTYTIDHTSPYVGGALVRSPVRGLGKI